jgi:hypothetical protein
MFVTGSNGELLSSPLAALVPASAACAVIARNQARSSNLSDMYGLPANKKWP